MKKPNKYITILVLLLIVTIAILVKIKFEKDVLQKNIDLAFANAISDSMSGLSKDYSKIDANEKIQYYYQTVTNLYDALELFNGSSYKEYDEYFNVLNRLYIYLLQNKNEYEIEGQSKIFEFLGKSLSFTDDNQLIYDFNEYLDIKVKEKDNNAVTKTIDLNFIPVPKEILNEGLPKEEWIIEESIYFGDLSNQIESTLHLYVNTISSDLEAGEGAIYGFLEHENKLYELGVISNYGIDDVNVNLKDRTYDGIKEIEIEGWMGATYSELKIVSYNEIIKQWENILTMGTPTIVDLDMDGKEDLIAGSAGSLPPYIDIYKWNNDHFGKADIVKATESDYSTISQINGTWLIETGLIKDGKSYENKLYKYEEGKLIEQ